MGMWEDVLQFHRNFKIPQQTLPSLPDASMCNFRLAFLKEEVSEFEDAIKSSDPVKAFDALIDLVYVALGTAVIFNFPFQRGWDVVHAANMRKARSNSNSNKARHRADVIKPLGWISPEKKLRSALLDYEYDIEVGLPSNMKESNEDLVGN